MDNELEYMKRIAENKALGEVNDQVNPTLLSPVRGGSELYLMAHEAKEDVEAVTKKYIETASGIDEGQSELAQLSIKRDYQREK